MKLYAFDDVGSELQLLPLAARRALDSVGLHLSRKDYEGLTLEQRRSLAALGSQGEVDLAQVRALVGSLGAPTSSEPEPDAHAPPEELVTVLGEARPLSAKVWASLDALDRYVLVKTVRRGRERGDMSRLGLAYEEIVGHRAVSTHLRPSGGVGMVRMAGKPGSERRAVAECVVSLSKEAFARLQGRNVPKGDVLTAAQIAGIQGAKRTSELIPLCHPIALSQVQISFRELLEPERIVVTCEAEAWGPTGVEMEAMSGASVAALTIYDMMKSLDRAIVIGPLRLIEKTGGRSGPFFQEATR